MADINKIQQTEDLVDKKKADAEQVYNQANDVSGDSWADELMSDDVRKQPKAPKKVQSAPKGTGDTWADAMMSDDVRNVKQPVNVEQPVEQNTQPAPVQQVENVDNNLYKGEDLGQITVTYDKSTNKQDTTVEQPTAQAQPQRPVYDYTKSPEWKGEPDTWKYTRTIKTYNESHPLAQAARHAKQYGDLLSAGELSAVYANKDWDDLNRQSQELMRNNPSKQNTPQFEHDAQLLSAIHNQMVALEYNFADRNDMYRNIGQKNYRMFLEPMRKGNKYTEFYENLYNSGANLRNSNPLLQYLPDKVEAQMAADEKAGKKKPDNYYFNMALKDKDFQERYHAWSFFGSIQDNMGWNEYKNLGAKASDLREERYKEESAKRFAESSLYAPLSALLDNSVAQAVMAVGNAYDVIKGQPLRSESVNDLLQRSMKYAGEGKNVTRGVLSFIPDAISLMVGTGVAARGTVGALAKVFTLTPKAMRLATGGLSFMYYEMAKSALGSWSQGREIDWAEMAGNSAKGFLLGAGGSLISEGVAGIKPNINSTVANYAIQGAGKVAETGLFASTEMAMAYLGNDKEATWTSSLLNNGALIISMAIGHGIGNGFGFKSRIGNATIEKVRKAGYNTLANEMAKHTQAVERGATPKGYSEAAIEELQSMQQNMGSNGLSWSDYAEVLKPTNSKMTKPGTNSIEKVEDGKGYRIVSYDVNGVEIERSKVYDEVAVDKEFAKRQREVEKKREEANVKSFDLMRDSTIKAKAARSVADRINFDDGKSVYNGDGTVNEAFDGITADDVLYAYEVLSEKPAEQRSSDEARIVALFDEAVRDYGAEMPDSNAVKKTLCERYGIEESAFDAAWKADAKDRKGKEAEICATYNSIMSRPYEVALNGGEAGTVDGRQVSIKSAVKTDAEGMPLDPNQRVYYDDGTGVKVTTAEHVLMEPTVEDPGELGDRISNENLRKALEAKKEALKSMFAEIPTDVLESNLDIARTAIENGEDTDGSMRLLSIALTKEIESRRAAESDVMRAEWNGMTHGEKVQHFVDKKFSGRTQEEREELTRYYTEHPSEFDDVLSYDGTHSAEISALVDSMGLTDTKEWNNKYKEYKEDEESFRKDFKNKFGVEPTERPYGFEKKESEIATPRSTDESPIELNENGTVVGGDATQEPPIELDGEGKVINTEQGTAPVAESSLVEVVGIPEEYREDWQRYWEQNPPKDAIDVLLDRMDVMDEGMRGQMRKSYEENPDFFQKEWDKWMNGISVTDVERALGLEPTVREEVRADDVQEQKEPTPANEPVAEKPAVEPINEPTEEPQPENEMQPVKVEGTEEEAAPPAAETDNATEERNRKIDELLDFMGIEGEEREGYREGYISNPEALDEDFNDYLAEKQKEETEEAPKDEEPQKEEPTTEGPAEPRIVDNLDEAMPMLDDGEPNVDLATPRRTRKYLYEESGLEAQDATDKIDYEIKKAKENAKKTEKGAPKMGDKGIDGNIGKFKKAQQEWNDKKAAADAKLEYWNEVKRQQGLYDLIDEIGETKNPKPMADLVVKLKSRFRNDREILNALNTSSVEPRTVQEACMLYLSGGARFVWDSEGARKGLKQELGYGEEERKKMIGLLSKDGTTVQKAVHDIIDQYGADLGLDLSESQVVYDALLEALGSISTKGDIYAFINERRLHAVEDILRKRLGNGDVQSREEAEADARANEEFETLKEEYKDELPENPTEDDVLNLMEQKRQESEDVNVEGERQAEDTLPDETGVNEDFFESGGEDEYVPFRDGEGDAGVAEPEDGNAPTFYSNAARAVEGIKQNKATAEQWLAMIKKNGGLKAGEDKWMGLSQWLEDNKGKSLTKEEVQQFIADNGIEMEETTYSEAPQSFDSLKREYDQWLHDEGFDYAQEQLRERFGDDADIAFDDLGGELVIANEEAAAALLGSDDIINQTRLDYTTNGLDNKREIAFKVPNVEPYQEHDEVHFGPENQGKAVMWVRFGETTDTDGKRVLVIDEIQSNRHQDAREKGYRRELTQEDIALENNDPAVWTVGRRGANGNLVAMMFFPKAKYSRYGAMLEYLRKHPYIGDIPAAPFEKNWHEVAMKRMLRLAAEEGFDKVAWTTGEQQAKRYSLGRMYDSIEREDNPSIDGKRFVLSGRNMDTFLVNKEGNIEDSSFSEFNGKPLSDVVGKELAERMMNLEDGDIIEGEQLNIGGEGMKGFYDQMLPRFMDKYGKRWGTKTGEVQLATPGKEVMHAVDVTPEMKESVMQGQPLFRQQEPMGERGVKKVTQVRAPEYREGTDYFGRPMTHRVRPGQYKLEGYDDIFNSVEEVADFMRKKNPDYCVYIDEDGNIGYEAWSNILPEGVKPNTYAKILASNGGKLSSAMKKRIERYTQREMKQARTRAEEITKELGLDVEFHDDPSEFSGRKSRAKGWYDPKTGKIHIVMGNHSGVSDVMATMLHEGVAHHGLRKLFGEDFDTFLDNVHNNVSEDIRTDINGRIDKMRAADQEGAHSDDYYRRAATEEYLADLAEDGLYNREQNTGYASRAWQYIKESFINLLRKAGINIELTDDELRYILWSSHKNLRRGAEAMAEDAVMREKAGIKDYVEDGEQVRTVAENDEAVPRNTGRQDGSVERPLFREDGEGDGGTTGDLAARLRERMRQRMERARGANNGGEEPRTESGSSGGVVPPVEPPNPSAPATPEPAPELPPTDYDRPMSPIEMAQEAAIKAVADTKASLEQRNTARRELDATLKNLHKAMRIQKEYDRATVENVVSLCKMMVQSGLIDRRYISNLTPLFTKLKETTGKQDLTSTVNGIMDVMLKSHERSIRNELAKLLKVTGTKVDENGVVKQAGLDIRGQHTMKEFSEYMNKGSKIIDKHIEDLEEKRNRIPEGATERLNEVDDKILGSQLAKQYSEIEETHSVNISQAEEDLEFLKERYKAGEIGIKDYTEQKHSLENLIRSYRMAQTDALWNQIKAIHWVITDSKAGSRNWVEQQKERQNEIRHDAYRDMQGTPSHTQGDNTKMQEIANSALPKFFSSSLFTLQTMLKSLGNKHALGEGYLYNRFFKGWMENRDAEITEYRDDMKTLNTKARELTGHSYFGIYNMIQKLPKMTVDYYDGGEMRPHDLDQGQLGYAYMVNKMEDGAAALRNMGITEEKMQEIANFLDPNLKKFYDWLQDDFLAGKWDGMNEVHKRLFGADMDRVANYIPLRRDREAGVQKVDISKENEQQLQSTVVGSIIKRVHSNLGIDLKHNNAIDVVANHLLEATHWKHFSEWKRDSNSLLSDTTFRNKVKNSTTIYGSGKILWERLNQVFQIAGGDYKPSAKSSSVDKAIVDMARTVNTAKVSMRVFTATKQLLSLPVFATECNTAVLMKNLAFLLSPNKTSGDATQNSFVWCIENLPQFRERWVSRIAGETRLENGDLGWGYSRQKVLETAGRIGLTPNAFIDACTVAAGAKSIYEKRYSQYKKDGFSEAEADRKAKIDAEIAFNESQQSSEKAFVAPLQVDRTAVALGLSTFRNASMGYERKFVDAIRNFRHLTDHKDTVEFMKKQMVNEGLTETQAKGAAERLYRRALWRSTLNFLMFGFGAQMAWNVGGKLPYLIFGEDDEEKKEMVKQAAIQAGIGGWVEGLPAGDMLSEGMTNWAMNLLDSGNPFEGKSFFEFDPDLLTVTSDAVKVAKYLEGKNPLKGATAFVNLLGQIYTGVNPETFTDAGVAIYDACDGKPEVANEALMCILRILQCPQSQLDQMYIDELKMSARQAQKLSPEEVARRYAYYKAHKDTPYMWWMYNQGKKDEIVKKYEGDFSKKLNEDVKEAGGTPEDYHDLSESATTEKETLKYRSKEIDALSAQGPEALMKAWEKERDKGAAADYKYIKSLMTRYQKDVYGKGKTPTDEDEAELYQETHGEDIKEQAQKIGRDLGFGAQDSYFQMSQYKAQHTSAKDPVMKEFSKNGGSFKYSKKGKFFKMEDYNYKVPVKDVAKREKVLKVMKNHQEELRRNYRNGMRMAKIKALYKDIEAESLKKERDSEAMQKNFEEILKLLEDERKDAAEWEKKHPAKK